MVAQVGTSDSGEFLLHMQANAPTEYHLFLDSARPKHTSPDGSDWAAHETQPVETCVSKLLTLIIRTVEHNTSALTDYSAADGVVQANEAYKFMKNRSRGLELVKRTNLREDLDFAEARGLDLWIPM